MTATWRRAWQPAYQFPWTKQSKVAEPDRPEAAKTFEVTQAHERTLGQDFRNAATPTPIIPPGSFPIKPIRDPTPSK